VHTDSRADPDPYALLELACTLVDQAAELVSEGRSRAVTESVGTKSTPTDVVTAMDTAAERLVVEGLRRARPGDAVLGEEGGERAARDRDDPVRWLLDPIDGTVNYLYGIPQYAVSLAAEVAGTVVAGVVRNPASGEEWTAVRGGGGWRGRPGTGTRLSGPTTDRLDRALVSTGFAYKADRRAEQARVVAALLPEVRDIRRIGAAALDLCFVAEGRLDAHYESGLKPWDSAAGGLVASEAGLLVTGLRGEPASGRMTLVAPPALHGALHDRLVALDAEDPEGT
jgi:myo-inositol-1(or 4)-monophosphatase